MTWKANTGIWNYDRSLAATQWELVSMCFVPLEMNAHEQFRCYGVWNLGRSPALIAYA